MKQFTTSRIGYICIFPNHPDQSDVRSSRRLAWSTSLAGNCLQSHYCAFWERCGFCHNDAIKSKVRDITFRRSILGKWGSAAPMLLNFEIAFGEDKVPAVVFKFHDQAKNRKLRCSARNADWLIVQTHAVVSIKVHSFITCNGFAVVFKVSWNMANFHVSRVITEFHWPLDCPKYDFSMEKHWGSPYRDFKSSGINEGKAPSYSLILSYQPKPTFAMWLVWILVWFSLPQRNALVEYTAEDPDSCFVSRSDTSAQIICCLYTHELSWRSPQWVSLAILFPRATRYFYNWRIFVIACAFRARTLVQPIQ